MDTPDFTVENIEKALHQLYYDPVIPTKDEAQRWLMYAQRSKQAWLFAWELLQANRAPEVQYFGASALVTKISGSWSEIPEEEIESLKNRLYVEILRLCASSQDRMILTRVCVAFSAFVMNCVTLQRWDSAVSEIVKKFQDESNELASPIHRCTALLEILTVMAEEYQSKTMTQHHRQIIRHMLMQGVSQVLSLMSNLLSTESIKDLHSKVVKCISSWIVLGLPLDENKELLLQVLSHVKKTELFESCVECLLNAFCSPHAHQYPNTISEIVPKILELRPMLHKAIEEQDTDVCLGITKLVCGLAENQTKLILKNYSNPELGLGLVLMVAECTGIQLQYPTDEISSPITFTFWYTLQDEVQSLPESDAAIFPQIQPIYYHLVETLLRKSSYPSDSSHTDWSSDEKEQHRIYRVDISDTLMYVLEMLGPAMIQFLCNKVIQSAHAMKESQNAMWQETESVLFGIHSVVETYLFGRWEGGESNLDCLNGLAQLLPTISLVSIMLADTVLNTIGALSEWMVYHPQYLATLIPIVLPCLRNNDLALTTVLTLKRLTRECEEHMQPYADSILGDIQDCLMKGILRNNQVNWLMQSAGHILSVLPEDECLRQLQVVLTLHMHQLQALSEDPPTGPTKNSIIHILEILTSLFSTLDRRKCDEEGDKTTVVETNEKQPVLMILEQITPILQEILNKWIGDKSVVSAICTLYDKSIRNLLSHFSPLVATICEMLAKMYQAVPQTSVIDLTQQVILVYGADSTHKHNVGTLLRSLIETSRQMFEGGHAREHPDLAQSFLHLIAHTLKKRINLFEEIEGSPSLPAVDFSLLFHCGLATIALPESESVRSATSLFMSMVKCVSLPSINTVISQNGKTLLATLLKGIGGAVARTVMDNIADTIFDLSKHNFQQFVIWVHELRQLPDIPCANLDRASKEAFMSGILKERASRSKYRDLAQQFALVCRGIHGTEYAAR